jgi:hypothetical protein
MRAYETIISSVRNSEVKTQRQYAELLLQYGRALMAAQKYEEADKMLSQAQAIAEAFVLPGDLKRSIDAEVEAVKQHVQRNMERGGGRNYYSNHDQRDAAEHEFLMKAAIEYARQRYGARSMTFMARELEYAQFLSEQQRLDDLATQATVCRDTFGKLAPEFQAQMAPKVIQFAKTLAEAQLPVAADTVGSIVMAGVMAGTMPTSMDVASHLEHLGQALERHQNTELAQKYFAASVRAFEKQLPADDPRLAKMRTALASFYRKVGKNGAAIELLELSLAAQTKNAAAASPEAITALSTLTDLYCITGNVDKAKDASAKLVAALSQPVNNQQATALPLQSILQTAGMLAAKGQLDEAEKLYTAGFGAIRKQSSGHVISHHFSSYDLGRHVKELATRLGSTGNADQAERVYDAWIQATNTALGQPTSMTLSALVEKTNFFLEQETYDKADEALTKVVELSKKFPNTNGSHTLSEMARQLMQRKQYELALKAQLAWQDSIDHERHVNEYTMTENKARLAKIYNALGKHAEAKAALTTLQTQAFDKVAPGLAPAQPILKSAFDKMLEAGHFDQATELLQAIGQTRSYSSSHDALSRPAYLLQSEKLYAEAAEILQMSLEKQSALHGPSSYQAGNTMRQLASAYSQLGENTKATEMLKAANAISILQSRGRSAGSTQSYNPRAPLDETLKAAEAIQDLNAISPVRRVAPIIRPR